MISTSIPGLLLLTEHYQKKMLLGRPYLCTCTRYQLVVLRWAVISSFVPGAFRFLVLGTPFRPSVLWPKVHVEITCSQSTQLSRVNRFISVLSTSISFPSHSIRNHDCHEDYSSNHWPNNLCGARRDWVYSKNWRFGFGWPTGWFHVVCTSQENIDTNDTAPTTRTSFFVVPSARRSRCLSTTHSTQTAWQIQSQFSPKFSDESRRCLAQEESQE